MKTQIWKLALLACTLLSSHQPPADPAGAADKVEKLLEAYQARFPQEKMYIHQDKPFYVLGEDLHFKVYLMDAIVHGALTPSQVVHVALLDPDQQVAAHRLLLIENGSAAGDLALSPGWTPGKYTLTAYTGYMRNFPDGFQFQREILLLNPDEKGNAEEEQAVVPTGASGASGVPVSDFHIQFLPEGGAMVEGLPASVSFKAVDPSGAGVDVKGAVEDQDGRRIAGISSLKFGLGFTSFTPQPGRQYHAVVAYNGLTKTVPMPLADQQGYTLRMVHRAPEYLTVFLGSNLPAGLNGAFLLAQIRGNLVGRFDELSGKEQVLKIPLDGLPAGVIHFTLFDPEGRPHCERLAFVHPAALPEATLKTDRASYEHRQRVEVSLVVKDSAGVSPGGDYSVAVTDENLLPDHPYDRDIRSYIWLESELKGRIENPGYYFEEVSSERVLMLDLLLRTQGWSRFAWKDVLEEKYPTLNHRIENDIHISGVTTRMKHPDEPVEAEVFLTVLGRNFSMQQGQTGADGRFDFGGFQWKDSTDIILQGNLASSGKKKKNQDAEGPEGRRRLDILVDAPDRVLPPEESIFHSPMPVKDQLSGYQQAGAQLQRIDSMYNTAWSIDLDEVVVAEKKYNPTVEFHEKTMMYKHVDNRLIADSIPGFTSYNNIFDFLRGRVPGIEVRGSFPEYQVFIRGQSSISLSNPATILLDGVTISSSTANAISPQQIAFIDVIRGLSASSIFGAAGRGGVIALYTYPPGHRSKAVYDTEQPGIVHLRHPGYYQARAFYNPVYDTPKRESDKPDYRTLLYWNPKVAVDEKGTATLVFYTGDRTSTYRIQLEGMTGQRDPVVITGYFEVR
ncbi:MAG: TonB-dependent receptor plug domain-containing protein [Lewinella sp.]|nr:TonB-dependent receptor plug domain-containing protein [Lewinella sp.]